jgi:two-component system, chemotaxis family, protein-glutamate methylesterase/glutaminase
VHMPSDFTAAFARKLDSTCRMTVQEARQGDPLVSGRVLIAPGHRHLRVVGKGGRLTVQLLEPRQVDSGGVVLPRPSVDLLFESVAECAGPRAIGVILTGMGDDGARGLALMRRAGAATLAQDEPSCVCFGMPGEACRQGAVEDVVPLSQMAATILRRAARPGR